MFFKRSRKPRKTENSITTEADDMARISKDEFTDFDHMDGPLKIEDEYRRGRLISTRIDLSMTEKEYKQVLQLQWWREFTDWINSFGCIVDMTVDFGDGAPVSRDYSYVLSPRDSYEFRQKRFSTALIEWADSLR